MDGETTVRILSGVTARSERLPAIDRLRGLAILLMVLDHVRWFFTAARFDPSDLTQTTPGLFFTRWLTHLCAPSFVFLAGMSARLHARELSRPQLQRFLFTRGLWLIALEFSVIELVGAFNLEYRTGLTLQVIWVLGASMCLLAALVALPVWAVGAFGLVMIVVHDAFDGIAPARFGAWAPLWNVLHVKGPVPFGFVLYPIIPWLGVMAVGYAYAELYRREQARSPHNVGFGSVCGFAGPSWGSPLLPFTPWIGLEAANHAFAQPYRAQATAQTMPPLHARRGVTAEIGLLLCGAFLVLRLLNGYGDPHPWTEQGSELFTLLSFLDTTKYPPSLIYLTMTLGPCLLLLAALQRRAGRLSDILETFGRVPLFAYVLHIALAHALAGLVGLAQGYGTRVLLQFFVFYPRDWGFSLGGVYVAYFAVLALLYPLCRWFAGVKRRRRDPWLAYL